MRFAAAARPRLAIDRDSILFKMCEMALPGLGRAADELMGGGERRVDGCLEVGGANLKRRDGELSFLLPQAHNLMPNISRGTPKPHEV